MAASSAKYHATLSAPNGEVIYLDILIHPTSDPLGLHDAFFCVDCFGWWLTVFGEVGSAMRERGIETTISRTATE